MTPTSLHQTLIEKANSKVAFVFDGNLLSQMLLREFQNSYKQSMGKSFPIDGLTYPTGLHKLQAKLTSVVPNIAVPTQDFFRTEILIDTNVSETPIIKILDTFSLSLEIHKAGDPAKVLFDLKYEVSLFNSVISVSKGELELNNQIDFSVNHKPNDRPEINQYQLECELSNEDLLTLKGTLFYILPKKIISSQFLGLGKIKLSEIFTPFSSLGDFNIELVYDTAKNYTVLILKEDITLDQLFGCGINLGNIAPEILLGKNGWEITPKQFSLSHTEEYNGIIMTYIPKKLFEQRFDKVAPAVSYTDSDNGFIGYDLDAIISLKYVSARIDVNRKCLVVGIELYIRGYSHLTIDAGPCIGRMNLADCEFHIENCSFDIVLGLDFAEYTNLYLKSNIENLQMGATRVTLEAVSKWAGLAGGKGAIIGFIVDIVLARILQHNIPIEIGHTIEKQGNIYNIKLMDLSKIEKVFKSNVDTSKQSSYYTETDNDIYQVNYDKIQQGQGGRLHSICSSFDDNSILYGVGGYD